MGFPRSRSVTFGRNLGTDEKFPFLSRENKMRQTPPASPVPPKFLLTISHRLFIFTLSKPASAPSSRFETHFLANHFRIPRFISVYRFYLPHLPHLQTPLPVTPCICLTYKKSHFFTASGTRSLQPPRLVSCSVHRSFGAGVPSDQVSTGIMNSVIGSGAP